ncbi:MAG: CYTH domain-containing protein, partial [Pseudomonadota bacterium]
MEHAGAGSRASEVVEVEIKVTVDGARMREVWPRVKSLGLIKVAPRARLLRSTYFDTAGHALRAAGIALRLRKTGRTTVQTVKAKATLSSGLSRTGEWHAPAPDAEIDLGRVDDDAIRALMIERIGSSKLAPICETVIRRQAAILRPSIGQAIELAVDQVELTAGDRKASFHEVELELKEGSIASAYELLGHIFPDGGLDFSEMSKSARGYLLAAEGVVARPRAPQKA